MNGRSAEPASLVAAVEKEYCKDADDGPGDQDDDVAPVEIACVEMGGDNMAGGAGGKCVRDSLDDAWQGNAADSAEENHAEGDGETDGQ